MRNEKKKNSRSAALKMIAYAQSKGITIKLRPGEQGRIYTVARRGNVKRDKGERK